MNSLARRAVLAFPLVMAARPAAADPASPVLLELFTSQGCSSCPPADAVLSQLAMRAGVVALSWHVDYWNRLGWRDPFSLREATQRQRRYAEQLRVAYVYTPQLVVDGAAHVVGSDRRSVDLALEAARRGPPVRPPIRLARDGGEIVVRVGDGAASATASVLLVHFLPAQTVAVRSGENAGRSLSHTNIVRRVQPLGDWSGAGAGWRVAAEPGQGAAAIVQAADGRVLGAASLPA
jgi:hypothetical protein